MGLCLGICVLHSPNALRKRIDNDVSYSVVDNGAREISPSFFQSPLGFFKGRKPLWWAWWLVRVGVLIMIIVVFIVLLNNFYMANHTCKWCKYLSCIVSFTPETRRIYDQLLTTYSLSAIGARSEPSRRRRLNTLSMTTNKTLFVLKGFVFSTAQRRSFTVVDDRMRSFIGRHTSRILVF